MSGNKDIVAAGKSTQFGQPGGADPSAAGKKSVENNPNPHLVRQKLKRLAAFKPGKPNPGVSDLAKAFGKDKKLDDLSMSEIWAITMAAQAMGNWKAMSNLVDSVDGKLLNKEVTVQVDSLADLVNASMEMERNGEITDDAESEQS